MNLDDSSDVFYEERLTDSPTLFDSTEIPFPFNDRSTTRSASAPGDPLPHSICYCSHCFCSFDSEEALRDHEKDHENSSSQPPSPPLDSNSSLEFIDCSLKAEPKTPRVQHPPLTIYISPVREPVVRTLKEEPSSPDCKLLQPPSPANSPKCSQEVDEPVCKKPILLTQYPNEIKKETIRKYRCKFCSRSFVREKSLKKHIDRHHGDTVDLDFQTCLNCQRTFTSRRGLYAHLSKNVTCETTHAKLVQEQEQLEELEQAQTSQPSEEDGSLSHPGATLLAKYSSSSLACNFCLSLFLKVNQRRNHERSYHSDLLMPMFEYLTCSGCKTQFPSQMALKAHWKGTPRCRSTVPESLVEELENPGKKTAKSYGKATQHHQTRSSRQVRVGYNNLPDSPSSSSDDEAEEEEEGVLK